MTIITKTIWKVSAGPEWLAILADTSEQAIQIAQEYCTCLYGRENAELLAYEAPSYFEIIAKAE